MEQLEADLRRRAKLSLYEARTYLAIALVGGVGLIVYFTTFASGYYNSVIIGGSATNSTITVEGENRVLWEVIFTQVTVRIGAVLLAIFAMQILVSFARYKFRLSDNINKMADICHVSQGDLEKMKFLASFYLNDMGDITQFLRSPVEGTVELAKEAISRIPKP